MNGLRWSFPDFWWQVGGPFKNWGQILKRKSSVPLYYVGEESLRACPEQNFLQTDVYKRLN